MTRKTCLARDRRGTVLVETLIVFMPLFLLFLGTVQYALLAGSQLIVQHAAVAGVRAAVVVLEDDPAQYEDAELRVISMGNETGNPVSEELTLIADKIVPAGFASGFVAPEINLSLFRSDSPRMKAIRHAVHARLASIVPPYGLSTLFGKPGASVRDALGDTPALRLLQAPLYLPVTTAVTFPKQRRGGELWMEKVDATDLVTLRVTHIALCGVPVVARIMCGEVLDYGWGDLFGWTSDPTAREELNHAPAAPLQKLLRENGARAVILRAEASLPVQAAPYAYASQKKDDES